MTTPQKKVNPENFGIKLSGCAHAQIGPVLRGSYCATLKKHHGKMVYKKNEKADGRDVFIYYFKDDADASSSGWWMAPEVGSEEVWGFSPGESNRPPRGGWKVPYDGAVDATMTCTTVPGIAPQKAEVKHVLEIESSEDEEEVQPAPPEEEETPAAASEDPYGGAATADPYGGAMDEPAETAEATPAEATPVASAVPANDAITETLREIAKVEALLAKATTQENAAAISGQSAKMPPPARPSTLAATVKEKQKANLSVAPMTPADEPPARSPVASPREVPKPTKATTAPSSASLPVTGHLPQRPSTAKASVAKAPVAKAPVAKAVLQRPSVAKAPGIAKTIEKTSAAKAVVAPKAPGKYPVAAGVKKPIPPQVPPSQKQLEKAKPVITETLDLTDDAEDTPDAPPSGGKAVSKATVTNFFPKSGALKSPLKAPVRPASAALGAKTLPLRPGKLGGVPTSAPVLKKFPRPPAGPPPRDLQKQADWQKKTIVTPRIMAYRSAAPTQAGKTISLAQKGWLQQRPDREARPPLQLQPPKRVITPITWTQGPGGQKRKAWSGAQSCINKRPRNDGQQLAAVDAEGRLYNLTAVVVNFANVGATYAKKVLKREPGNKQLFDWEGIRKCVTYLTKKLNLKVVGVIYENFMGTDNDNGRPCPIPADIRNICESIEETPRIQGYNHSSADDEMTIKCAYHRNCRFMDNDNYRDWKQQLRDEDVRAWLERCQDLLHMRYYFDSSIGVFETLDGNVPPGMLAPRGTQVPKQVSKQQLWTAARVGLQQA